MVQNLQIQIHPSLVALVSSAIVMVGMVSMGMGVGGIRCLFKTIKKKLTSRFLTDQ
jgi:hypothetical protein